MTASAGLMARILPPAVGGRRAGRLVQRNLMVYRHSWMIVFSGFFEPVFYLFSLGVGLNALVGTVEGPGGEVLTYTAFVAPGLLAASAMNGAILESTMNIYFKLRFAKVYDAVLATPLGAGDVALGEILWCVIRASLYGIGFLVVAASMGLVGSWWAVLALPSVMLIGFAFASAGMAATTFMRSWNDFELIQLAIVPMFLFSATFYPLSVYPGPLQVVVQMTPLYHGVGLIRALTTGTVGAGLMVHVGYLAVMGVAGVAVAGRRVQRLLLQ